MQYKGKTKIGTQTSHRRRDFLFAAASLLMAGAGLRVGRADAPLVRSVAIAAAPVPEPRVALNYLPELELDSDLQQKLDAVAQKVNVSAREDVAAAVRDSLKAPLYQFVSKNMTEVARAALAAQVIQTLTFDDDKQIARAQKEQAFLNAKVHALVKAKKAVPAKIEANLQEANAALAELKGAKQQKLAPAKEIFDLLCTTNIRTFRVVGKMFHGDRTFRIPAASVDAAAFRLFDVTLQEQYVEEGLRVADRQKSEDALAPRSVTYRPAQKLGRVSLSVPNADIQKLADMSEAEAGVITDPDGKAVVAKIILARLATGYWGNTVKAVMENGGFEPIQHFGGLDNLPKASSSVVEEIRAVAQDAGHAGEKHKALFFQNSKITKARGTDFGTTVAWQGTLGDTDSPHIMDTYLGYRSKNGDVMLFDFQEYSVKIIADPKPSRTSRVAHKGVASPHPA